MQNSINQLLDQAKKTIANANTIQNLEYIRTQLLGKKGQLTELLKSLGQLPAEQRSQMGQIVNQAKQKILALLDEQQTLLQEQELQAKLTSELIDVTVPGRGENLGNIHPINRIAKRVEELFTSIGFTTIEGPEIEHDYYAFEALNIPATHPARASMDTFYLKDGSVLRPHTSSVQIRFMEKAQPPLRMIAIGRVYRCDSDQTHTPMFHQLEGLVVDDHSTFANLKFMLQDFLTQLFESNLQFRFRPSFFPFTEPSAEMDIRLSSSSQWLEVLGCGMVHPNVLKNVGIDSEKYSGFAFGIGLDRLAMLRYGVNDLRKFFENDIRFLKQF